MHALRLLRSLLDSLDRALVVPNNESACTAACLRCGRIRVSPSPRNLAVCVYVYIYRGISEIHLLIRVTFYLNLGASGSRSRSWPRAAKTHKPEECKGFFVTLFPKLTRGTPKCKQKTVAFVGLCGVPF